MCAAWSIGAAGGDTTYGVNLVYTMKAHTYGVNMVVYTNFLLVYTACLSCKYW